MLVSDTSQIAAALGSCFCKRATLMCVTVRQVTLREAAPQVTEPAALARPKPIPQQLSLPKEKCIRLCFISWGQPPKWPQTWASSPDIANWHPLRTNPASGFASTRLGTFCQTRCPVSMHHLHGRRDSKSHRETTVDRLGAASAASGGNSSSRGCGIRLYGGNSSLPSLSSGGNLSLWREFVFGRGNSSLGTHLQNSTLGVKIVIGKFAGQCVFGR